MENVRLIEIGGDMAPLLSWIGVGVVVILLFVALVAMGLWVIPPLKKGDTRMVVPALVACLALPGIPAALVYTSVWKDVHTLRVEANGDWLMSNSLGVSLGQISGKVLRRVSSEPWAEKWDSDSKKAIAGVGMSGLYVEELDGHAWGISGDDVKQTFDALGYKGDSPCNLSKGGAGMVFEDHRFSERGPGCSEKRVVKAPPKPKVVKRSRWNVGDNLLVIWAADGWWYPAKAIDHKDGQVNVRYADGSEMVRSDSSIRAQDFPESAEVQVNWEGKGFYYGAEVVPVPGGFKATYEDGSSETVDWSRLRMRFSKG